MVIPRSWSCLGNIGIQGIAWPLLVLEFPVMPDFWYYLRQCYKTSAVSNVTDRKCLWIWKKKCLKDCICYRNEKQFKGIEVPKTTKTNRIFPFATIVANESHQFSCELGGFVYQNGIVKLNQVDNYMFFQKNSKYFSYWRKFHSPHLNYNSPHVESGEWVGQNFDLKP